MNKYIKENINKIINIFILLQPILDLITGISVNLYNLNITIGIVTRMLFLMFVFIATVFVYKKKTSLYAYLAVFTYSLLYLIGIIIYKNGMLFTELQGLLKVIYFPLILVSLYDIKEEFKISNMTLFTTLFLYLILILIPNILGVGFESYKIAKIGSLGFFNSANEISGIISILTPILFIIIKEIKNIFLKIIFAIIYLIVILNIGTKTPLLSLLIVISMTFLYYTFSCIKNKNYKPLIYISSTILILFSSLLLVMPKTNFYKNIKIHLDYLEVENITDIFKDKQLIDHFIFSQRLSFLENKVSNYSQASLYEKIFGIGYTKDGKITKLIEMDYFDILYSHGIIGFFLIFSIYGIVLYKISKSSSSKTFENYMLKISILLIIVLSLFTGHIITAPTVSIFAIIIILNISKRNKKRLLFTAVNFDIGGIETALVNLLNNIDYSKYDATVILEKKYGIHLDKVNKNAKVEELSVSNIKNIIVRKTINFSKKLWFIIFNYHNYDFSCCYATYSLSGNKLALAASKNTSIYLHSDYKHIYNNKEDFINFFDSRHIRDFKNIFTVSNESKKSFIEIYEDLAPKCHVYNNFIDVDSIIKKSKVEIDAKKTKNKLLVFIGRLEEKQKKFSRTIDLMKEIKDLDLWVIGDGPDREMYEKLVKKYKLNKRITFYGKKENPYPYLRQADYLILTSDYEGFPVTYLEAIVLNKGIITTVDVSDDQINIGKDFAYIVSKEQTKMVKEVQKILKQTAKTKKIDFKEIQRKRIKNLEMIFDEVI